MFLYVHICIYIYVRWYVCVNMYVCMCTYTSIHLCFYLALCQALHLSLSVSGSHSFPFACVHTFLNKSVSFYPHINIHISASLPFLFVSLSLSPAVFHSLCLPHSLCRPFSRYIPGNVSSRAVPRIATCTDGSTPPAASQLNLLRGPPFLYPCPEMQQHHRRLRKHDTTKRDTTNSNKTKHMQ